MVWTILSHLSRYITLVEDAGIPTCLDTIRLRKVGSGALFQDLIGARSNLYADEWQSVTPVFNSQRSPLQSKLLKTN